MSDGLSATLPSLAILGTFALVALALTLTRGWARDDGARTRSAVRVAAVAILAQAAHFSEELATGFHERFPALFGLGPMSLEFFVSFNVVWLVLWSLCLPGLAGRHRAALFALWFLSIGCLANAVAHPVFAVLVGEYFPGLLTSPVVGVLGLLLFRRLLAVTTAVPATP